MRVGEEIRKGRLEVEGEKTVLRSGRGRYTLGMLPAQDYPTIEPAKASETFSLPIGVIKRLIDKTQFAMAQQDVRYYLNGLLLEIRPGRVRAVATDGHRLALCDAEFEGETGMDIQVILPRKAVIELGRLLEESDAEAEFEISSMSPGTSSSTRRTSRTRPRKSPSRPRSWPTPRSRSRPRSSRSSTGSSNRIFSSGNRSSTTSTGARRPTPTGWSARWAGDSRPTSSCASPMPGRDSSRAVNSSIWLRSLSSSGASRGSTGSSVQSHSRRFRLAPQVGQSPLHSPAHVGFSGRFCHWWGFRAVARTAPTIPTQQDRERSRGRIALHGHLDGGLVS